MSVWPASLTTCPLIGWSEAPTPNTVHFETEVGPPKRRRRSSNGGTMIVATYKLSRTGAIGGAGDQLQTFWNFYQNTLKDGTLEFSMKNPRTNTLMTAYFEGEPQLSQEANGLHFLSMQLRMFV